MSRRGHRVSFSAKAGSKREHAGYGRPSPGSLVSAAAAEHDYTASDMQNFEEEFPALPVTPSKSPVAKKKICGLEVSPALVNQMHAQFESIKALINTRCDALECKITTLEVKIESVATELNVTNTKVVVLEQRADHMEQRVQTTQRKLDELESHSRRVNLRLFNLPETDQENVRDKVISICQQVVPELKDQMASHVDVAHRLGAKWRSAGGPSRPSRPRAVIVRFAHRWVREEIWKAAKASPYLQQHELQFKQDFSKGDRERRERLWPLVQKARSNGKTVFFRGPRAFIEGEGEIFLPE